MTPEALDHWRWEVIRETDSKYDRDYERVVWAGKHLAITPASSARM